METPVRISFQGSTPSEALSNLISEHLETLERLHGRLTSCQVVVQVPDRHHRTSNQFRVGLLLHRRGRDIVAGKGNAKDQGHADVYAALRDSFDSAERQLEELER